MHERVTDINDTSIFEFNLMIVIYQQTIIAKLLECLYSEKGNAFSTQRFGTEKHTRTKDTNLVVLVKNILLGRGEVFVTK